MGGRGSGRKPYRHLMRVDGSASQHDSVARPWPVRNPACTDVELQDEAVSELQRLWDACLAQLVIDGERNPLLDELERLEAVCLANEVILPSRNGNKIILRFMAEGMIAQNS